MKRADVPFSAFVVAAVALAFLVFYGGASALSAHVPWRVRLDLPFEQAIPFLPWTAVIYLSMDLLVGLAPFVLKEPKRLAAFGALLVVELLIACVFFVLMPVVEPFPPRVVEGAASGVFAVADTLNLERNFFPSLHVAFSVTAALAYRGRAWWLWAAAIAVSTLTLHEHCLLDVVGGVGLAFFVHARCFERFVAFDLAERLRTEWLVFTTLARVGFRHRRYVFINVVLYAATLFRRGRRALRTGYALLQLIDDVLDGDRPVRTLDGKDTSAPEFAERIKRQFERAQFTNDAEGRLAAAFHRDAPADALALVPRLIDTMQRDFERRATRARWSEPQLLQQHRATFEDSLDLLLICGGAKSRAAQLPSLVELLGWASTVRDLEEDLRTGLVNVPRDVDPDSASAMTRWLAAQSLRARTLLVHTDDELSRLEERTAAKWLGVIARSTRKYLRPEVASAGVDQPLRAE